MSTPPDPFLAVTGLEGVPSTFAAARDGIDSLLRDRGLRRSSPETTGESLLLGAAATAALEGSTYDIARLRSGEGDPLALAAARMSTELLGLVPVWDRAPLQALARMHALVAAGSVDEADLGRPVSQEGAHRLNTLARSVAQRTAAPGLVVAAVVHAEVASADAFCSHNALVGRAAERVVLVSTGVDPASVTVPEAGHHARAESYRAGLDAYAHGGQASVRHWLLYAAEAFALGAEVAPLERPRPRG